MKRMNFPTRLNARREQAAARQAACDKLSANERLLALDEHNLVAKRERAALAHRRGA